ncbi:helix-turn-helix domain-containing protein [Cohnella yongneupensis]|uniref:Helix-turn-helix domain-containing protein n=1 Tax=Cohnella yongneupensis TaxID=425006 RepID=A0ABW0QV32_9BACL
MRVLQGYKSRKYLLRILLSVSFIMVIVLFLSSAVVHYSAEKRVIQMQKDSNRKVMSQINHNVTFMQEIIKNTILSLYNDELIFAPITANQAYDDIDIINSVRLLNKELDSSSFLHSILVYNGRQDKAYAVGSMADQMKDDFMVPKIVELLKREEKLPQMQLLPMNFSGKANAVDVFSLVIYETFRERNHGESAIVVNVKPEWIFDNLKVVNDLAVPGVSELFIMDDAGTIINSGGGETLPKLDGLADALRKDQTRSGSSFGVFTRSFDGSDKYMVSYMEMGVGNWKVISVQPYNAVLGGIYKMRITSVYVIVFFVLLAIALSFLISHKLYKPIEAMLRRIREQAGGVITEGVNRGKDELTYVTNVYSDLAKKLDVATNEQDKQRNIVRNYHLRSIITSSESYGGEDFRNCIAHNGLRIAPEGPYLLVLLKIDRYTAYLARTSDGERKLHAFAVSNIAEEILAPSRYRCETADMRSDHLVMLVSADRLPEDDGEELLLLIGKIQDIVEQYYKLSLTATTSEWMDHHKRITEQYGLAQQGAMYKLVFGCKSIITPAKVKPNLSGGEMSFPPEHEKKLIEAIRTNDLETMQSSVEGMVDRLAACHYDHILHGILHLVDLIKTTLREMNQNRVVSIPLDLGALSRQVLEQETLLEVKELLLRVCGELHEKMRNSEQDKNAVLIDAIKEIVDANYSDMNISLQGIASTLRMTPAYVGRIFKMSELVSVAEYINEVRLRHARDFLETKSFTIKEIMELVGYLNESTFFKLFKKRYGVTPKEYRLKRNIG